MRRWVVVFAGGLLLAGLGVFLTVQSLDNADKWASVFGLFVGLAGLGVAVSGVAGARRQSDGQSVTDSSVGGSVTQVSGVCGNVRFGPPAPAGLPPAPPSPPSVGVSAGEGGQGQSVTRSWTAGPVRQVNVVDGDVELDR